MSALPRSYLFVPGNRPERFDKAYAAGADAVILDLEDAVQQDQKVPARATVVAAVSTNASRAAWVRINGSDTPWFPDDVAALVGQTGVAGIVLPKAETREQINAVLANAHPALSVLPIVETARGFANLAELCSAPRVLRIVFGTLDFRSISASMGMARSCICFARRSCLRRGWLALVRRWMACRRPLPMLMRCKLMRGAAGGSVSAASFAFIRSRSSRCIARMHGVTPRWSGRNGCLRLSRRAMAPRLPWMGGWSICR